MMKHDELELTRRGVTPAQFAAYVRQMLKKHGIDYVDIDLEYWKRGGDLEFDYHDDPDRPCAAERSISKPYEMQTYIRNWDGTVYNQIMEFDHWDDKTGFGYFYLRCDWENSTEEPTTEEDTTTTEEEEEKTMTTTETKTTEQITKEIIAYFEENEDVFNDCIEELDSSNGYLGDDRYYSMDELDELYSGTEPSEILRRAFYGHDAETYTTDAEGNRSYGEFNPNRDYFTFNGYGNLVSADYKDYSAHLDHWAVESMLENRQYIDSIDRDDTLCELFDELENAED